MTPVCYAPCSHHSGIHLAHLQILILLWNLGMGSWPNSHIAFTIFPPVDGGPHLLGTCIKTVDSPPHIPKRRAAAIPTPPASNFSSVTGMRVPNRHRCNSRDAAPHFANFTTRSEISGFEMVHLPKGFRHRRRIRRRRERTAKSPQRLPLMPSQTILRHDLYATPGKRSDLSLPSFADNIASRPRSFRIWPAFIQKRKSAPSHPYFNTYSRVSQRGDDVYQSE